MAVAVGLGVTCWSPLAGGVLTGKYTRADLEAAPGADGEPGVPPGRKAVAAGNGFLTPRGLDIAQVVSEVAAETGTTSSRVALAWTLLNPAVTAPIIGARSLAQLDDNLGALKTGLDDGQQARLDQASAVELGFPHEALRRLGYRHT